MMAFVAVTLLPPAFSVCPHAPPGKKAWWNAKAGAAITPGRTTLADLAAYQAKRREAVCTTYRAYWVCGMGPPSSGGLAVGQILGLLAPHDLAAMGPDSPTARALIADATRLAFADRERYMADIDYVPMPLKGLTDPDYLRERAALLTQNARQRERLLSRAARCAAS